MFRIRHLAAAAVLALPSIALAGVINVPTTEPTIQDGIDAAKTGDEVVVAPGVYNEAITFNGKAITVRSSGGADVTIIDGTGVGDSPVVFEDGEGAASVLDGFTIENGTGRDLGVRSGGGGMFVIFSNPTITNCILRNNSADDGAAVYVYVSNPRFINVVMADNDSTGFQWGGGGMYADLSNPLLTNCTVYGNDAADGGGFYSVNSSIVRLINCVVRSNTPDQFAGSSAPIITYSNIQGGASGEGNVNFTPGFADPANGDFTLLPGSANIDRGDSTAIAEVMFKDLAGNPRGVDDPNSLDRGVLVFGLNVDIGAYEYQVGSVPVSCPGDIDGPDGFPDGEIGFFDLIILLGNWGPCP